MESESDAQLRAIEEEARSRAVLVAASRLRVDHGSVAAIGALVAAGVPSILLKGPSVSRWLFDPEDARGYGDTDLLVSPAHFEDAVAALKTIGFHPDVEESEMPSWWREHALSAVRDGDGATIDLHHTLPGAFASEQVVWSTLWSRTETLAVGGIDAIVLSEPARLLHIALATAQTAGSFRDRQTLARALDHCSDEAWREAADVAQTLDASAAFERGLRFIPAGVELIARLALSAAPSIEVELQSVGTPEALTLVRVMSARNLAAGVSIVRHKLAPPATFMRKWSPLARRGPLGLAAAYLWRPVWIASRLPAAVDAYRRARRG